MWVYKLDFESEFFGGNEILARAVTSKFRFGMVVVDLMYSGILQFSLVISGIANLFCMENTGLPL
jgi:hypothetical protein